MRCAVLTIVVLALSAAPATAQEDERPPNVLVVMTDDQRADASTMAVMPETRHRIARQGVTFAEAHATTPKCCPSRASFFTGLYIHNHNVISNARAERLDQSTTVQRLLKRVGYRTGIFGKYLNSWPVEVNPPYFDEWAISNGGFRETFWNTDGRVHVRREYTTDYIADRAVRFIRRSERRDRKPWLMWVTPHAPHEPSTPAARHRTAFVSAFPTNPAIQESDWSDKPPFLEHARHDEETLVTVRDDGRRSLMAVDEMVGRLLDEVKKGREVENTLVVFTSDNGFMMGEHGGVVGKDLPYPASTRIPLVVRWPGHFRRNRTSTKFVANVDLAPTVLEAAGVVRETDGHSLLEPGRRRELFVESRGSYNEDGARSLPAFRSVRTANYRYAEYYENGGDKLIFREYYDLVGDPWELQNIAPSLEESRLATLSARLRQLGACRGRACP